MTAKVKEDLDVNWYRFVCAHLRSFILCVWFIFHEPGDLRICIQSL